MKFENVLNALDKELLTALQSEKELTYYKAYEFLTNIFKNDEFIKECDKNNKNLTVFINKIYELGFYNGFKFGVDPDDLYPETLEKLSNI